MRAPIACLLFAACCAACADQPGSPTPATTTSATGAASTAGAGKGKVADMAVTTTVMDLDANGSPASITSDGQHGGAYTNGVGNVVSILTANGYNSIANGDWQFDTKSSTTRSVGHGFYTADEIAVNPPLFTVPANPPYLGMAQNFPSRLQVECTLIHKSMLTMAAKQTITCGLGSTWNVSSTVSYGLSPDKDFTGFQETTDIQIVCNNAAADGCNDWTLEPDPALSSIGRLNLSKAATHGNGVTTTDEGDFYVRFLIHVTRP